MNTCLRVKLAIATCFVALFSPVTLANDIVALRVGAIVDPDSASEQTNQIIIVDGPRIRAIGQNLPIPSGARIIDLSDKTVLPGLIDAHTHLFSNIDTKWDLGEMWLSALRRRPGYRAILGAQRAKEMLESGFTTVRDLGNSGDYLDVDLKTAIDRHFVSGPTIVPAGRIIAPYGGQFEVAPSDSKYLDNPEYRFADSHDELRKAIRENLYWGAQVIKLVVDARPYQYSAEDIRFVVDEAARANVKVAAHVQTEKGARAAIEAKVASIEHGWELTDEDLSLARKNGVVLVSTDFTVSQLKINGFDENAAKEIHARRIERLRRAYQAGVTVVFGTDIMNNVHNPSRGEQALEYLDSFTEAGVPAKSVLRAITTDAARLLGVDHERGFLKPGLMADLIAVNGDPLRDIATLKTVIFVMKEGSVVTHP